MPNKGASYQGPTCGAKNKAGFPCKAPAMANGRCRVHGGATPAGPASPHWRHGRHSGHLGPGLGQRVEEQLADPDRHSMVVELALVDARTGELLESLQAGAARAAWAKLERALLDFRLAQGKKDAVARMHTALETIEQAVAEGTQASAGWDEVLELIERRRILVESEERRALAAGRAVPADQVAAMLNSLAAAVLDELPDQAAQARVVERARRLLLGQRHALVPESPPE